MKKPIKFAAQLKELMKDEGLNQQELAQLLGVSQPAISLYLRGRIPPAEILLKMAVLGHTTIDWLLTGSSLPTASVIQERAPGYSAEQTLLFYWKQLKPEIRSSLFSLIKQLAK
jgi:transcriptional regulator with XRE-family HTH domain